MPTGLPRLALILLACASGLAARGQVVINEFMAQNVNSVVIDEDGEHEDWMELQNYGATTVSLNGWYLTDDAADLRKWRFPVTTVGSSRVDLQACKLEYSIVSPK